MKTFIENHEAVIVGGYYPQKDTKEHKIGDVVPHRYVVSGAYFYRTYSIGKKERTDKIWLPKDMILELSGKIHELQAEVKEMEVEPELPF